jgi:hypothetical protein
VHDEPLLRLVDAGWPASPTTRSPRCCRLLRRTFGAFAGAAAPGDRRAGRRTRPAPPTVERGPHDAGRDVLPTVRACWEPATERE